MTGKYQDRVFLNLLDDTEETLLVKDILKSPLKLAADIIKYLFDENLDSLKDSLDDIKKFAAGIRRAEKLASSYSLASYYQLMFSFHQFVQSSYRARQGKVLEKIIQHIIRNYGKCDKVPVNTAEMLSILSQVFNAPLPTLDIDAMGMDSSNGRIIIIQLRSRDDTGGTTAKGSLVDLLRELLRINRTTDNDVLYLVCIWDARKSQQKNSTIRKIYSSLEEYIEVGIEDFFDNICTGVRLKENITLKMVYGADEIADSIFKWTNSGNHQVLGAISRVVDLIENWDDLWISYAIASLEIEVISLSECSNIKLLNEKCKQIGTEFDLDSYEKLVRSIDGILGMIIPIWIEDSIPLESLCDKAHYVRDLLFLKACYEKLSR